MNNIKRFINYPIVIFIATLFLSIGYASINSITLDITGVAKATPKEGIYITEFEYVSDINAIKENSKVINVFDNIFNSHIELSNTDLNSSITYRITINNVTKEDYAFDEVIYSEEWYDNPLITFDLDGIKHGDVLRSKESISFNITFHYDCETITNNALNSYLNFSFKRLYKITYVDIEDNGYPTEIIDGGTLNIQLDSLIDFVVVYKDDVEIKNFTYENLNLIISNIDGNIRIEKDYVFSIGDGSNVIEAEGISPENPTTVNDILNQVFEGKNTTSKTIDRLDVTYVYTSSTGSAQKINCILEVNGKIYTKEVLFNGKATNAELVVSFDRTEFEDFVIDTKDTFTVRMETNKLTNGNISITGNKVTVHFAE